MLRVELNTILHALGIIWFKQLALKQLGKTIDNIVIYVFRYWFFEQMV